MLDAARRWTDIRLEGAAPAEYLRVEQQSLDLLLRGVRIGLLTALLGPGLSAWLFSGFVGPWWAWGPAALVYALNLERILMLRRMAALRALHDDTPGRWAAALVLRIGLMGCLISAWNYAALRSDEPVAMMYALGLSIVVCAGAMTQYCIWPAAVWVFVTPLLLGMAAQLLWVGRGAQGQGHVVTAVFMVALWATLLTATTRFARAQHGNLLMRLRNEELTAAIDGKRRQAEAASAAKSRFLAAASHDLRQPVHAMSLLGEALRQQLAGTPQAPLMGQMLAGVDSFSELVDEVLDLARIDAGAVEARMAPVPVPGLLARAETSFRASAAARGLAFWLRPPVCGGDPVVWADAALLWRVVGNLVANAVRYTPAGGVMLAVRRARLNGQPAWRIEVRDSGPGIALHQREAIFDEFYQAHDAHRTRAGGEGHGLGLSVARRMARLMGADVRLHPASAHGPGAVFSITLAAAPAAAPDAAPHGEGAASSAPPDLRGLRVLVVDDDPAARQALHLLLQGWGASVHNAATPAAAASAARRAAEAGAPVQVLVTDHWLADGALSHDVLAAVRPHAPPTLRVAVVSGGASEAEAAALAQGGAVFLRKPVRPQALRDWLNAESV
ncbi:MAG: hybrid sensor histidine kinase/response regulator [Ottowia sp.]|uniref:ATP-binding protein n=1 Tax=Ottowia sp. TaxID=1898956 RepID=UPI0039E60EA4